MTISHLLKSSGLAAIAATLAVTALPAQSFAQDRERWSQRDSNRGSARSERSSRSDNTTRSSRSPRSDSGESRSSQSSSQQSSNRQSSYTPPRRVDVPASRVETRSAQSSRSSGEHQAARTERNRSYSDSGRNQTYATRQASDANRTTNRTATRESYAERRFGDQLSDRERARVSRITERRDSNTRDSNYRDRDRDRSYSDRDRNRSYSDRNGSYRDGYRDGHRDYERWDHHWRDDHRYNWYGYRDRNRSIFHLGIYYSPYRNYSYRRLSIGYFLDSLFFANRYWIDDPWRYRLPQVYGPYRWVRYYDDVLLVDIYNGEVVDVIYDFFW